jgi:hypothetical protein
MSEVRWYRLNDEPFEYAIQDVPNGEALVQLKDGTYLRRPINGQDLTEQERYGLRYLAELCTP